MKRISTAAVAAATALSLATVPAMAQEDTAATTTGTTTEPTAPATETTTPATTEPSEPATETTAPATETTQPAPTTKPQQPKEQEPQSSGSSQGTIVGIFSGTLGAVLTTALIVFSDPRGANKIIDMANAQFGLGLPHLHTPKVQLPNFQLPNLPF